MLAAYERGRARALYMRAPLDTRCSVSERPFRYGLGGSTLDGRIARQA
jgi:hypothetical protein